VEAARPGSTASMAMEDVITVDPHEFDQLRLTEVPAVVFVRHGLIADAGVELASPSAMSERFRLVAAPGAGDGAQALLLEGVSG
jgi:hypothetical protein